MILSYSGRWSDAAVSIQYILTFYLSHTRLSVLFDWTWNYLPCLELSIARRFIFCKGSFLSGSKRWLGGLKNAREEFFDWLIPFTYWLHVYFSIIENYIRSSEKIINKGLGYLVNFCCDETKSKEIYQINFWLIDSNW